MPADQPSSQSRRGPVPDPAWVDWEALARRLYEAGYRVPIKQHDRTPEQQAAVENFTQASVEASDVLHGPELGMIGDPVEASPFVARENWRPTVDERKRMLDALDRLIIAFDVLDDDFRGRDELRRQAIEFGREVYNALADRYYGDA